mgnify:CR=1 FL=1
MGLRVRVRVRAGVGVGVEAKVRGRGRVGVGVRVGVRVRVRARATSHHSSTPECSRTPLKLSCAMEGSRPSSLMRFALATCLARGSLGFVRRISLSTACDATAARCTRSSLRSSRAVARATAIFLTRRSSPG